MTANYHIHNLLFKRPGGTSRGIMQNKETWFLIIKDGEKTGIGECGILRNLSIDDRPDYEKKLQWVCDHIHWGEEKLYDALTAFPSIQIGIETAFLSLKAKNPFKIFPSAFTEGEATIPINGLVWMGDKEFMSKQVKEKIAAGFRCIKMKIGAIDFETEMALLRSVRKEFSASEIELRVDANGAFGLDEAMEKLNRLSDLQLHSIEQPIRPGQWEAMAALCKHSPLPIALDEELIGVFRPSKKEALLQAIKPHYIILKPSLIGGFRGSDTWIDLTEKQNCGWWITSALESNVGLNAIAQYTFTKGTKIPQGLGTGSLYTNNIESPLYVSRGALKYRQNIDWGFAI